MCGRPELEGCHPARNERAPLRHHKQVGRLLWNRAVIPLEMSGLRCGFKPGVYWDDNTREVIPLEMSGLRCGRLIAVLGDRVQSLSSRSK